MFQYECYISCYAATVSFTKFGDQMNCLEQREILEYIKKL